MIKTIRFTCSKITYTGDSIGDDIRVEIEILGKFFSFDKKIKLGQTILIDKEIGQFESDQSIFEASVAIKVIEQDLVFNDVGAISAPLKVYLSTSVSQEFIFPITIQELKSTLSKAAAVFEITLRAEIAEVIRYVADEGDGWIKAKFGRNLEYSLPAYLRVRFERTEAHRDYFTILEGFYRDKKASFKREEDGSSHLIADVQYQPGVQARYSISQKLLTIQGRSYKATDDPRSPWDKGFYDIEMPDAPHGIARGYIESKRPLVWFRIGHEGARYLHVGQGSLGCLTIIETARWSEIYEMLIRARKGDSVSVGVLEVVD